MSSPVDKDKVTEQLRYKRALEAHFAEDFSTLTYPMLAKIYLDEGDLIRAQKVCRIGLTKHPEHVPGLYLLAVISIRDGQMVKAEGLLEQTLELDPYHLEAAEFLVAVQERLKRSPRVLEASYRRLLVANPRNQSAKARLERIGAERNLVQKVKEQLRSRDLHTAGEDSVEPGKQQMEPEGDVGSINEDSDWELHIRQVAEEIQEARDSGLLSGDEAEMLLDAEPDLEAPTSDSGTDQAVSDAQLDQASEELIDETASQMGDFIDDFGESPIVNDSPAANLADIAPGEADDSESSGLAERPMLEEETGDPVQDLEGLDPATQVVGVDGDLPADIGQEDESALDLPPQPHEPLKIDPKLATFTLATIYKVQGLFVEALEVLNMLEDKGADQERIDDERDAIRNLMESGNAGK
ncbi:tetratricopeptide repeat protein [Candidatus Neomarinimicrobiota bacterium]